MSEPTRPASDPTGPTSSAEDELRARLSAEQYDVTQCSATERPFTGEYWDCHDAGVYRCVVCDAPLYSSETKFESGTGWPSFVEPIDGGAVDTSEDTSLGVSRTEVTCSKCGAHLGHVFPDGPAPAGTRYCMNSASLRLDRDADPVAAGDEPSSTP